MPIDCPSELPVSHLRSGGGKDTVLMRLEEPRWSISYKGSVRFSTIPRRHTYKHQEAATLDFSLILAPYL